MDSSLVPERSGQLRSAKKAEDSTFDRIWKYYFDKDNQIELSDAEEKQRKRWEYGWTVLGSIRTKKQAILLIQKKYKVSTRTAYDDIANAEKLFGDPVHSNKAAKKAMLEEWLTNAAHKAYKKKDFFTFEKLIARIEKLNGFDKEDKGELAEMMKNRKPIIIQFTADPEVLKKQAEALMEGVEETQDIEYEELDEED